MKDELMKNADAAECADIQAILNQALCNALSFNPPPQKKTSTRIVISSAEQIKRRTNQESRCGLPGRGVSAFENKETA